VIVTVTVAVEEALEPSVTVYVNVSVAVAPALRLAKAPLGSKLNTPLPRSVTLPLVPVVSIAKLWLSPTSGSVSARTITR
jgi:hypothetical protein